MKKEFDLKIDGGTLESIKIDSSNSLIIATYKRDVEEFKAGDILIDAYDDYKPLRYISIFKEKLKTRDGGFSASTVFDIHTGKFRHPSEDWDEIKNNRLTTDEEKQILFDALKKEGKRWNADKLEIEKLDISEIVVDYETAIKYLGIKDTLLVFKNYDRAEKFNAQIKLQLIAEAWNKFDGFEADWNDSCQQKFFTVFFLEEGKLQIDHGGCVYASFDSQRANFSFKTEERASQFSKQFIDLFKIALGF